MFYRTSTKTDRFVFALLLACLVSTSGISADETDPEQKRSLRQLENQERLDAITAEIRRRRANRGDSTDKADSAKNQRTRRRYNPVINGAVYPAGSTASLEEPIRLVASHLPLYAAGEIYAKLVKKEVMISGKVAARAINVKCPGVSREEAISEFNRVFAEAGVAVMSIDETTVALLNSASNNETE